MFKKLLQLKTLLIVCLLAMVGTSNVWAEDVTYTFSSKSWGDSNSAWTSGKSGNELTSGRGVQVTKGTTGANATTKSSFSNVSHVVVTYSTNASSGAGSIGIKVGSNTESTQSVTNTGGTTDRTLTYDFSPTQSGTVKITVNCTTNSIYVKSVKITTSTPAVAPSAVSFTPASGSVVDYGSNITITSENADKIYYTVDGTDPTTSTTTFINSSTGTIPASLTIKAMGQNSMGTTSVATATYTYNSPSTPSFSPEDGEVVEGTAVTISSVGAAKIYFTTDGTTPTTSSTELANGGTVTIDEETTLKAIGWNPSGSSDVATASYTIAPPVVYEKITSATGLVSGAKYLLVYEASKTSGEAYTGVSNNIGGHASVTISSSTITNPSSSIKELTLGGTSGAWTLYDADNEYYLALESANNYLHAAKTKTDNTAKWKITYTNGVARIENVGTSGRYLRYNTQNPRFACYTSGQQPVTLYCLQEEKEVNNLSVEDVIVEVNDMIDISEGLTITTSSDGEITFESSDPTIADIEDGYLLAYKEGITTITATQASTQDYMGGTTTFTVTVNDNRDTPMLSYAQANFEVEIGESFGAPSLSNPNNLTVTYSSMSASVATVNESTGAVTIKGVGTTIITANFAGNDTYKPGTASYTLVVSPSTPVGIVVWKEDWSGFDTDKTPAVSGNASYVYTNGNSDTKLYDENYAGGSKPELLINKSGGAFAATIPLFGAYGNMTLSLKANKLISVKAKVDDVDNGPLENSGDDTSQIYTIDVPDGATQIVITLTNNSTDSNVRVDDFLLIAPQVGVRIGAAGYSTMYYGSSNLVVPADVVVRTYKVNNGELEASIEYTEGDVLAKAQGYVIKGTAGTYTFTATKNDASVDANNQLRGSDVAVTTTGGTYYYGLSLNAASELQSVGFYWMEDDGAAFTNGAHKAYLALNNQFASGSAVRGFLLNGTNTGVETLPHESMRSGIVYDLQGRRVNNPGRGLYIINGQKVFNK